MNLNITNPHFHRDPESLALFRSEIDAAPPRIRRVTNSPAEEYQVRSGQTQRLPDAFIALLCYHRRGIVEVTGKGVIIKASEFVGLDLAKNGRRFWHPDSPVCNRLDGAEKLRVIYTWMPSRPDIVHLLDRTTGAYLESLPAADKPGYLDRDGLAAARADSLRVQRRAADHLDRIHGADTLEEIDRASRNASIMSRTVVEIDNAITAAEPADPNDGYAPSREIAANTVRVREAQETSRQALVDADRALESRPRNQEPVAAAPYDPFDID